MNRLNCAALLCSLVYFLILEDVLSKIYFIVTRLMFRAGAVYCKVLNVVNLSSIHNKYKINCGIFFRWFVVVCRFAVF